MDHGLDLATRPAGQRVAHLPEPQRTPHGAGHGELRSGPALRVRDHHRRGGRGVAGASLEHASHAHLRVIEGHAMPDGAQHDAGEAECPLHAARRAGDELAIEPHSELQ